MAPDSLVDFFAASPPLFAGSPLYGRLCAVIAEDERLLAIAAEARAGQLPSNLLFAAVHYLLLADPAHELAAWYPSVGGSPYRSDGSAGDPGPAFTGFCLARRAELVELMRTRLVQANVVNRAMVLRLGMAEVAVLIDEPVTLIEVGCSAGAHLRFDDYRYEMADRVWGRRDSPVIVTTRWQGAEPPPDLDRIPAVADRVGLDLNPIDVADLDARRWLRALIWPENQRQAEVQESALRLVAGDPPRMVTGDAAELLPKLAASIPSGTPVVVFHAATRLHVPADQRDRFDAAIAAVGDDHRLFHLSFEVGEGARPPIFALELRTEGRPARLIATGDGHAERLGGR